MRRIKIPTVSTFNTPFGVLTWVTDTLSRYIYSSSRKIRFDVIHVPTTQTSRGTVQVSVSFTLPLIIYSDLLIHSQLKYLRILVTSWKLKMRLYPLLKFYTFSVDCCRLNVKVSPRVSDLSKTSTHPGCPKRLLNVYHSFTFFRFLQRFQPLDSLTRVRRQRNKYIGYQILGLPGIFLTTIVHKNFS